MKKVIYITLLIILIPIISFGQLEYKKTVYFATNSSTLDQNALKSIDSLVSICNIHANFSITLFGHTDNVGSNDFNQKLSKNRVDVVLNYFISKNIPAEKIKSDFFGETKPFSSNDSEINRTKNRRVEIIIKISKPESLEIVTNNEVVENGWPPSDGILVAPGTKDYKIPGTKSSMVQISVITTTEEMEAENISTFTSEDSALISNIMICVRRPVGSAPCELAQPLKIYIPASSNPFCKVPDVKFYDSEKDSIGNGMIKWKEILSSYGTETYNGESFFVITIRSLCNNPCKNFDCPKLKTAKAKIKLTARKYKILQADAIHEKANALLPGKEISKNYWEIEYFDFNGVDTPTIKLNITKKKKKLIKRYKLSDLNKDNEGNYIVTKKQIKAI